MTPPISDKIHEALSKYPRRVYPKGQILVFADESPEHIFYIVKGKVIKYDVSYRGDEVIVNVFKPPAFFPMSWAINKSPNKYFYKTDEPTELHIVPAQAATDFLQANPDVMYDLLSRLYRGMDGLLGRVVHLMSGTAKSRLMYELLIESRRFGEKQADGSYKLSTNELDIAGRAGMSRETVSREMRKLKSSKLVRIEKGRIIVNDLSALEAALTGEI
ncbi:MAG TPA: Crp/Fnr family transcriptional regulator [Candidatus Saccharimonadales bacterium]